MKMTPEDFDILRGMVTPLDTLDCREAYRNGNYPRAEFTKDIDKRYRWDLLFAAGGRFRQDNFMSKLYTYLDDSHIDTALKKLVPNL